MVYPHKPNSPTFQINGFEVDIFYPDGSHKKKPLKTIKKGEYGEYQITLPGSPKTTKAISHELGDVVIFTDGEKQSALGVTIRDGQPIWRISAKNSLSQENDIFFDFGYVNVAKIGDGIGLLTYSREPIGTLECVDDNNDGWGWNGYESCQTDSSSTNSPSCVDSDGDGWGWNGYESCQTDGSSTNSPSCVDSDGDGWGWNGTSSCKVNK